MGNGRDGVSGGAAVAGDSTVGEVRKREGDILYALVLMFTYGQLGLILWDMLVMVPGFAGLVAMAGIQNPGRMHPFGEMTTLYLALVGGYIGWNAYKKIKGREDTEEVPRHLFMRIQRGQFYMALWGTVFHRVHAQRRGCHQPVAAGAYHHNARRIGRFGWRHGNKKIS